MKSLRIISWLLLMSAMISAQNPAPPGAVANVFRISGTAVSAVDGSALSGIEITISPVEQQGDAQQAITGANGRFVFENLARGKYSLSGAGRGFTMQAYQQHDQYSTAVATGPGLVSENLVFRMMPDASIAGNLIDEDNEPVRSGEVILFQPNTEEGGEMQQAARNGVDEQGHFRFGHLRAGTYYIAVVAQPWYAQDSVAPGADFAPVAVKETEDQNTAVSGNQNGEPALDTQKSVVEADSTSPSLDVVYPITFYPNVTDEQDAGPIQLRPGEHATIGITLRAVAGARVRIVNGSRDPSAPLTAVLEQKVFGVTMPVSTRSQQASNGTLTVTGIVPGHLMLSIRHFNGKEWVSLNKEVETSGDTTIDATESSVGDLAIKGIVQKTGTAPFPPGTFVRFWNRETGENFGAQVNESGEFEVSQAINSAAAYNVAVLNANDLLVQKVAAAGARVVGQTIYFPKSGAVAISLSLADASGRIDGTVLQDDKPASESMVLLVPQHPAEEATLFRRDQSDSDGTFTLRQVLPGRYTVVAIERGWEINYRDPAVLKPYLERGEVVEVAPHHNLKISVKLQPRDATATKASSTIQ
jgi:Carboxypeptidase regulatory-like domain